MAVFSQRTVGYKLGLGLLLFSLMLFISGFSSPYWYKLRLGLLYTHGGLWQTCMQALFVQVCKGTIQGAPDWLSVTQTLQCMCLICLILSLFYAVLVNWIQRRPKHTRVLEMLTSLSSALGLAGTVLFIVQGEYNPHSFQQLLKSFGMHRLLPQKPEVEWALALSLTSCVITLITSIVIALHNSPLLPEEPTPTVGYMDPETGAVYPMVDVRGQDVFYIPPPPQQPPQLMGNFHQPVVSPCQPPSYESSMASAAHSYSSAVTASQYSGGAPGGHVQYGWNK